MRELGLEGDQVADTRHHGGVYQAVYAFAREDLDWWGERLGRQLRAGQFGENLTTEGIDVNEAVLGERWRIGTALLELRSVRIPCTTFKSWMGRSGLDNARVGASGSPPRAARSLPPRPRGGHPRRPATRSRSSHRPEHGVTVSTMFRALTTEPDAAARGCSRSTGSRPAAYAGPQATERPRSDRRADRTGNVRVAATCR